MNARNEAARAAIFANLRRSIGATDSDAPRKNAVAERLAGHPQGVIPARAQKAQSDQVTLFAQMAEAALASVARVDTLADVPAEAARFLRESNLPATLRMGEDARLTGLDWSATALETTRGRSHGADLNAISMAFSAVAETGTLIMTSGVDNPTTLNFLPDNHIVVLAARDVVGDMESVFAKLRAKLGAGAMPRTLNMITGPSRSADIAQTMLLGAHGPRKLHIIVVG
jgi:L-lactate dehydrogenase complex protein LldG